MPTQVIDTWHILAHETSTVCHMPLPAIFVMHSTAKILAEKDTSDVSLERKVSTLKKCFQSSSGNCFPLCLCSTSGDSTKTSRPYCGPPTGCSTPKLIYRCKKCPEAVHAQVFGDYSVLSSCRSLSWIFTLNTRKMVYSRPHIWVAAQILRVISHEALCQNSIWNPCGRLTWLTLWLLTLE